MIDTIGSVPFAEKPIAFNKPGKNISRDNNVPKMQDTISIKGSYSASVTYTGTVTGASSAQSLNESLRDYVINLLKQQGISTKIATGENSVSDLKTMTPEEAQKLISEDGYWGIEKTSDRIVEFATAAAGNDPAKLDQIKDAVTSGFNKAEKILGGALPEISYKTLDKIMQKLDQWAKNIKETNGLAEA